MARTVRAAAATLIVFALVAAGCGNSGSDDDEGATTTTDAGGTTAPPDGGGDRDTFVHLEGVPGVTDDTISYAVIGTRSNNPLGTCILDCYLQGIEAYFAYRNSEGGIYGRDLAVSHDLDDEISKNQARALEVISGNDSFGTFMATLLAAGLPNLDEAGVPTYMWGIHPKDQNGRMSVFAHTGTPCSLCTSRGMPYAAKLAGATKVASLGYGVTENSKNCATAGASSIDRYSDEIGAEMVYLNDNVDFGMPNGIGPEVTAMKEAGVDFITSCLDLNGMKTLGEELKRQDMDDVVMYHVSTYDQPFVKAAGGVFEGDLMATQQFLPFEAASEGNALGTFKKWVTETGGDLTELTMVGWINADTAFQGLLAAGPELDRQKVVTATNKITDYDADGLTVPIDWSRQHVAPTEEDPLTNGYVKECTALLRVVDSTFELVSSPEKPFLCWSNSSLDWSEPEPTSFG
jgi:hypothetical protein